MKHAVELERAEPRRSGGYSARTTPSIGRRNEAGEKNTVGRDQRLVDASHTV